MHAPLSVTERSTMAQLGGRNAPIGALRAFVTLLVIAHHTVLAYTPNPPPIADFGQAPYLWMAFPVRDPQKFELFGLLTLVNDLFFMSLMFFISGLFVADGLRAKGSGGFLGGRALRLGVPFVLAAGLLAPLAYFPAWLQAGGDVSVAAFASAWFDLPVWPSGPAWFLWVLLAFGAVATAINLIAPGAIESLGRLARGADRKPGLFFLGLVIASAVAYIPMSATFTFMHWTQVGPFTVQTSRVLHYFVYFLAGVAVGAAGVGQGLTNAEGKLAKRWWAWQAAPILPVVGVIAVIIMAFSPKPPPRLALDIGGGVMFALACATLSFAALATFLRFVKKTGPIGASLQANAYGMYLTHYVFTAWLAWLFLPQAWGGLAKGVAVFVGATVLSWILTMALRRLPLLGRIL
ncbi:MULTISPECIES: acyltransferase [unclassified Caulobacter]|jgi:peptidoglycan/LPS O-acetylase OafA/YrhL|uniref:acyltransferase family protein n=1 Tax=unclassified Caulobacter TaxID=2648921 RepID=UPI0007823E63|nr:MULTISPECIES: acyltransferase [unclassified Caulobacter]AZS21996.1 acyltransferase [Caulobacter sp. FWC26]